jgi:hypothetical protein
MKERYEIIKENLKNDIKQLYHIIACGEKLKRFKANPDSFFDLKPNEVEALSKHFNSIEDSAVTTFIDNFFDTIVTIIINGKAHNINIYTDNIEKIFKKIITQGDRQVIITKFTQALQNCNINNINQLCILYLCTKLLSDNNSNYDEIISNIAEKYISSLNNYNKREIKDTIKNNFDSSQMNRVEHFFKMKQNFENNDHLTNHNQSHDNYQSNESFFFMWWI